MTDREHAKLLFRDACDTAYKAAHLPEFTTGHRYITERDERLYLLLRAYNNAELLYEDARVSAWSDAETRAASGYHGGLSD